MKHYRKYKIKFTKLGKRIKLIREQRNISIFDLSCKTEIRQEYLKKIENGTAYGVLLTKHILKIAEALNVSLFSLFKNI